MNVAKTPGSLTEQAPLRGPDSNFNTNKNDNTVETTKNGNGKQNWGKHRLKKINNTYDRGSCSMAD